MKRLTTLAGLLLAVAAPLTAQYVPPACVDGGEAFTDVDDTNLACPWIEKAYADDTTDGCAAGRYCPQDAVTREQLAVYVGKSHRRAGLAVVARSGGEYTNPATAMADLSAWCGTPSASNPCLLKILPGTYTIAGALSMSSFVDIEGSGEGVTKITSPAATTLNGASAAELRWITVENTGAAPQTYAIRAMDTTNFRLTHVTATATGNEPYGVFLRRDVNGALPDAVLTFVSVSVSGSFVSTAITNIGTTIVLKNVRASASGGLSARGLDAGDNLKIADTYLEDCDFSASGASNLVPAITNSGSRLKIHGGTVRGSGGGDAVGLITGGNFGQDIEIAGATISGSGGGSSNNGIWLNTGGGNLRIQDSIVEGSGASLFGEQPWGIYLATSRLSGPFTPAGGTVECLNNFDGLFRALTETCQLAQCSDGIDNDAGGGTDLADVSCTWPGDPTE